MIIIGLTAFEDFIILIDISDRNINHIIKVRLINLKVIIFH